MGRTREFHLRFTESEFRKLEKLAGEDEETRFRSSSQKNIAAYIRKKIFSGVSSVDDLQKELTRLEYQIRKIGVNINQVTAKINSSYASADDIKALRVYLHDVEISFLEMIRKIEETYGDHKDY